MSQQHTVMCSICLDEVEETVHICDEMTTEGTCKTCLIAYTENKIGCSFPGTCLPLHCPCHPKRIVDYGVASALIPQKIMTQYMLQANSTLLFLCGGCHVSKSIALEWSEETADKCKQNLVDSIGSAKFDELMEVINKYITALITVDMMFTFCKTTFICLLTGNDVESWQMIQNILKLLKNPERRNLLHLRYLRERPKFFTPCCSRVHCWSCRTKDYHDGKSCEENSDAIDGSVVSCPTCGVSLTKADGCNTVSCYCGTQFSWSSELEVRMKPSSS
jgi:hypothetical protein